MSTIASIAVNVQANTAEFSAGIERAQRVAYSFQQSLQRQIETFGQSSVEAKLYGLAQRGASEDVLASVRVLQQQLEGLKATKAAQEAAAREGAAITDTLRTADERYAAEVQKLDGLLKQGAITQQTYSRAVADAAEKTGQNAEALRAFQKGTQVFDSTRTAAERYQKQLAELDTLVKQGAIDEETYSRAVDQARAAIQKIPPVTKEAADAIAKQQAALQQGKAVYESTRTPAEKYRSTVAELSDLLKRGAIDHDTHTRAVKAAKDEFSAAGGSIGAFVAELSPVAGAVGVAVGAVTALAAGAVVATVAITRMVSAGIESTSHLYDQAQVLGITTNALAGLHQAAIDNASSAEAMDSALEKLNHKLSEAVLNGGPAAAAFQRLGLSANELANLTPDRALGRIADGMAAISNPAERAGLAVELFGKGGQAIIPVLSQGSAALARGAADAERYGTALSQIDAAKVNAAGDAIKDVGQVWQGVEQQLAIKFAPIVEAAANKLIALATTGSTVGEKVEFAFDLILSSIETVADAVQFLDIAQATMNTAWATAGAAVITGIADIGLALQTLLNKLPGVKVEFGDTLQSIAKGARDVAATMQASLDQKLKTPKWSDQIQGWVADVTNAANKAAAAQAKTSGVPGNINLQAINSLIDKLKEQASVAGLTAEQQDLLKLKTLGATSAQLAQAQALTDHIRAADQQKSVLQDLASLQEKLAQAQAIAAGKTALQSDIAKLTAENATQAQIAQAQATLDQIDKLNQHNKLMEEGKQLTEQLATPIQHYQTELDKLGKLLDAGAINWETYAAGVWKAQNALKEASKAKHPAQPAGLAQLEASATLTGVSAAGRERAGTANLEKINEEHKELTRQMYVLHQKLVGKITVGTGI